MTRAVLALIAILAGACLTPQIRISSPGGLLLNPSPVYGNPTLCKIMVGTLVAGTGAIIMVDTQPLSPGVDDAFSVLGPLAKTIGIIGSAGCLGQYIMRGKHRPQYKPPSLSAEDKERLRAHESNLRQGPTAPEPSPRTKP